jgi:phenylalanyl-tRNA synthetase beta subunit
VHPQVLENWNLEDPVAAMELDLDMVYGLRGQ